MKIISSVPSWQNAGGEDEPLVKEKDDGDDDSSSNNKQKIKLVPNPVPKSANKSIVVPLKMLALSSSQHVATIAPKLGSLPTVITHAILSYLP